MISLFNAIAVLALTWLASAAPLSADTTRVDDVLVLHGTSLQFDPVGGFNDTTRAQAWQDEYMKAVDLTKITSVYQKQQSLEKIFHPRDLEGDKLDKRDGKACLACMVVQLAGRYATNRSAAYNLCAVPCASISEDTMASNIPFYWASAGIGAYAAGNYAYDVWVSYGW